ncbi:hypothetical protein SDRG_06305 [Saprolegnia diclina VS20]|uniref:GFO/IDH/MocA-like oxidoreductase domain-containing protein n=1 Tax=Saprolegnia diclina (strain VS20) TaxID=1156394 RepID=T0QE67_SAPDV|nr:hypothetical protein SDRG_06305 [Saprolegnia diclina VS20]EQC36194.1 hypothetical protein SDRG_06305 [Saprolegnia diclina VS20]|eukprot:XP_008610300.1 hypothetical protein SDRG_06305 [Saprolegnia diclina VS20]
MCVTSAEASVLIETARANNVVLTVFQNRRWDSDFLTVRKLLENKTLGDLSHFEALYDRFLPSLDGAWRESADVNGGGLLYDLGAHLVDQMLTLFGPPTNISSDVQSQREGSSNDDYFRLECQYPGLLVVLTASMLVENTPKYTIRGANGSFIKYGEDGQATAMRAGRTPLTDGDSWGREPEAHYGVLERPGQPDERVVSERGNYGAFYIGVADTIQHGAAQLVHPEESAAGIAILEKAKAAFLAAQT